MLAFFLHHMVILKHQQDKDPSGLFLLCHMLMSGKRRMLLYQGPWYLPQHSFWLQHVMLFKVFELVVWVGDFKALHLLEIWFPALSPAAVAVVLFVAMAWMCARTHFHSLALAVYWSGCFRSLLGFLSLSTSDQQDRDEEAITKKSVVINSVR